MKNINQLTPGRAFTLTVLSERLGICSLEPPASVPDQIFQSSFFSVTRTSDELSIVCNETHMPKKGRCSTGWCCLQVEGPLDFSETGILSALSRPLAEAQIPIFVLSTYETDYLLVKEQNLNQAIDVLTSEGHSIIYDESGEK